VLDTPSHYTSVIYRDRGQPCRLEFISSAASGLTENAGVENVAPSSGAYSGCQVIGYMK